MRHYPPSYLQVPDYLEPVKPLPAVDELARAEDIRRPFVPEGTPMPYMVDVVRTFRLLEGKEWSEFPTPQVELQVGV